MSVLVTIPSCWAEAYHRFRHQQIYTQDQEVHEQGRPQGSLATTSDERHALWTAEERSAGERLRWSIRHFRQYDDLHSLLSGAVLREANTTKEVDASQTFKRASGLAFLSHLEFMLDSVVLILYCLTYLYVNPFRESL